MTFGFANGAMSAAFRVAFNDAALRLSNKNVTSKSRHLTKGEKKLALSVFGNDINVDDPLIFNKKFVFFQPKDTAMAPNGNIFFNPKGGLFSQDFSQENLDMQALFIHEMTHVWQFQHGVNVIAGALSNRNYNYLPLIPNKAFTDYGLEQQGNIVRDYFYLKSGVGFKDARPSIQTFENLIPFVK